MPLPTLPEQPLPDPTGDYARSQAWAMLQARYAEAGNYAVWATQVLQTITDQISIVVGTDVVTAELAELLALLDAMPATSITYTDNGFSDPLLAALKTRVEADLEASSTGLGNAEAALFGRHSSRIAGENLKSYNQITTQFSSAGWDMPPGGLLAKQTELNNDAAKRLTDVSADIMTESARLALDYNKAVLQQAVAIVDLLGRLYDSKVMRDFEKAKAQIAFDIEILKTKALVLSDAAKLQVEAALRETTNQMESLRGMAQAAMQMIANAMNSVSSSTSFGFSGSAGTHYDGDIAEKISSNEKIGTNAAY